MITLDQNLIQSLARIVGLCGSVSVAAAYLYVPRLALRRWIRQGRRAFRQNDVVPDDAYCLQLYRELRKAKAKFELRAARRLAIGAKDDWRAALAQLERPCKRRWNKGPVKLDSLREIPRTVISGISEEALA